MSKTVASAINQIDTDSLHAPLVSLVWLSVNLLLLDMSLEGSSKPLQH